MQQSRTGGSPHQQKVALISGGGSGIGAATAHLLASNGWSVAVTGRRTQPIEATAEAIGGLAIQADQSIPDDATRAVAETIDRFGRLDALIANAGIEAFGSVEEIDVDEWNQVLSVNVTGPMLLSRAAIPQLAVTKGTIAVVSSVAALASGPHYASYVTSKTALTGLVRSMAVDLGTRGIRVNGICPGWVATEMSQREVGELAEALGTTDQAAADRLVEHLPLRRMAEPAEIAACIEFLIGPGATFVTGTMLVADGGGSAVDVGTLAYRDLEP